MTKCRNLALILIAVLFCFAAGAEIIKIDGNRVLIRLNGKTVSAGERLDVVDANGRKKGTVKVTSFNEKNASAEIESGVVNVGMRVAKGTNASVNSYDFRVNPVGLISGAIDANVDFKITRDWTVGPQGIYLHVKLNPSGIFNSNYDVTAYGFGARANWFFDGAFKDGFYLGPSLEYLTVNLKTTDAFGAATGSAAGVMASCLLGYGWFWDNFNIMLGGGYAAVLGASSITIKDSVGNQQIITANLSGLTYEFSIGWAF